MTPSKARLTLAPSFLSPYLTIYMELKAIVEALMVASDDPLPASEIARLIRARVAESEDEALAAAEEGQGGQGGQGDYTPKDDASAEAAPATSEPEAIKAFAELTDLEVVEAIHQLNEAYESTGRSFRALERAKGWKIYTSPDFGEFVKHLFPGRKPKRLSGPAMETLAVIAYRQPVTKAAIDAVRGVSSDGMLQKLLDLELVKIGGRAELPGRPLLYETTDYFFEHFGIKSPEELPNALELRNMELPEPEGEEEADATEKEESNNEERQTTLADAEPAPETAPEREANEHEGEDYSLPDSAQSEESDASSESEEEIPSDND